MGQPRSLGPLRCEARAGGWGPVPLLQRGQAEAPGPFPGRQTVRSFSALPAPLAAILVIEFIYAIVGIVWLTQYYTSCNDLTAKNVTLGMSASPGVEGTGAV